MGERPEQQNPSQSSEGVKDLQPKDDSDDVKGGRRPPTLPRDDSWD